VNSSRTIRTVILVIMDLIVVLAVLLTARIVVEFFGVLASQGWAEALVSLTEPLAGFGIGSEVKTPYGGVFDVPATIVVIVLLAVEWLLGVVRSRV